MSARRLVAFVLIAMSVALPASAGAEKIPGRYIVVLKDSVAKPGAVAKDHQRTHGLQRSHVYRSALKGYAGSIPNGQLKAVRADSRVAFVVPDREAVQTAQTIPRGIDRIDSDTSSTAAGNGLGAVNVNVAVLDTGTDASHPDLNVVGGRNCTADKSGALTDPGGHGTHVGGTVGALDNDFGVVGVAPGARLFSLRVLNKQGRGRLSWALCGIDWVTATRTDSDQTNNVAVANMSLGFERPETGDCGPESEDALHLAICSSTDAGVTYVAAAGNDSSDVQNETPAAFSEVLAVTAMADFDGSPGGSANTTNDCYSTETVDRHGDADDKFTSFSNFATLTSDAAHTLAAPGLCILSTFPVEGAHEKPQRITSPGYAQWQGTSMASPHVAGTVALCVGSGECAGLTPSQIVQKMVADAAAYNTANPSYGFLGDPLHSPDPNRYYGYLIRAGEY